MDKKNKGCDGVSRRKFLRNAGLVVGGAATFGIGGMSLGGCGVSPACQAAADPKSAATQQQEVQYFGECVCPNCGASQPHPRGIPCRLLACASCGQSMGRADV